MFRAVIVNQQVIFTYDYLFNHRKGSLKNHNSPATKEKNTINIIKLKTHKYNCMKLKVSNSVVLSAISKVYTCWLSIR